MIHSEIKTNNNIKYFTIFAVLVLLLILLLSFNGFYWADDYGFMSDLQDQGIFANCYNGYFRWDGRFLSVGSFFQCFNLVYLPIEIIILIYTLCVLGSGFIMFYIIENELNIKFKSKSQRFFIILLFAIVLWIGSLIHASETIYWGTGGSYSFGLLLGAIWVCMFLKLQQIEINVGTQFLFLIFSFAVGGLTQNLSMPLITIVAITLICNFLENKRSNLIFNVLIFIFVVAGLIFIMIAPGNWLRLKDSNTVNNDNYNILVLIKNYFYVLIKFASRSIFAIAASGILAVAIALSNNSKLNFPKLSFLKIPKSKLEWIIFLQDYKWLLAACSSALPFMAIPLFSGRRTIIYFSYFIMIFVFVHIYKLYSKSLETAGIIVNNRNQFISKSGFIFLLAIGFGLAIQNLTQGAILKKAITGRENILKHSRGKTIHLQEIGPELNTICFRFADYPYTAAYVKSSQERYFGVKIILDK